MTSLFNQKEVNAELQPCYIMVKSLRTADNNQRRLSLLTDIISFCDRVFIIEREEEAKQKDKSNGTLKNRLPHRR